jgi:hypothetical protein
MSSLKQLLQRAAGEYAERKVAAECAAVSWEAFTGTAYDPRPYYFERYQQKRGRPVARASAKCSQYGFDAQRRCVVAREPKTKDQPAYEEFFSYTGANAESAAYRIARGSPLVYVTQQKFVGGKIAACDVLDAGPTGDEVRERYRYVNGRLQDIKTTVISNSSSEQHRFDILYDNTGQMIAVRKYYDYIRGHSFLPIYWDPKTAPSYDEMRKCIRQRLVELIPQAIGKRKLPSPAYCLAITYNSSKDDLPPVLAVGLESELRPNPAGRRKANHWQSTWNPKKFKQFKPGTLPIPHDDELIRTCDLFLEYTLAKSDLASPRKVLSDVALELNRRDWGKQMPVTSEFIVFVTDLDDELREMYWKRDLKDSLPAAKLQRLKRQKLV